MDICTSFLAACATDNTLNDNYYIPSGCVKNNVICPQYIRHQHFPVIPIQPWNLYGCTTTAYPVHVSTHKIQGDTSGSNIRLNVFPVLSINRRSCYNARIRVCPVDSTFEGIKSHSVWICDVIQREWDKSSSGFIQWRHVNCLVAIIVSNQNEITRNTYRLKNKSYVFA